MVLRASGGMGQVNILEVVLNPISMADEMAAGTSPFTTYVEFLSNGPDRLGGVARDHISARHLLSHASAIQRVDPR